MIQTLAFFHLSPPFPQIGSPNPPEYTITSLPLPTYEARGICFFFGPHQCGLCPDLVLGFFLKLSGLLLGGQERGCWTRQWGGCFFFLLDVLRGGFDFLGCFVFICRRVLRFVCFCEDVCLTGWVERWFFFYFFCKSPRRGFCLGIVRLVKGADLFVGSVWGWGRGVFFFFLCCVSFRGFLLSFFLFFWGVFLWGGGLSLFRERGRRRCPFLFLTQGMDMVSDHLDG